MNQIFDKRQIEKPSFDQKMEKTLLDLAQKAPVLVLDFTSSYQDATRFPGMPVAEHHVVPFASPPQTMKKLDGVRMYDDPNMWWYSFHYFDHPPAGDEQEEAFKMLESVFSTADDDRVIFTVGAVEHKLEELNKDNPNLVISEMLNCLDNWTRFGVKIGASAKNQGVDEGLWQDEDGRNNIVVFNMRDRELDRQSWGGTKATALDLIYGLIENDSEGVIFINEPTMWDKAIGEQHLDWLLTNSMKLNVRVWAADHDTQQYLHNSIPSSHSHWVKGDINEMGESEGDDDKQETTIVHVKKIHIKHNGSFSFSVPIE